MRWVNIINGIAQRVNEILGSDNTVSTEENKAPNYWSIQAAMLVNLRRLGMAMVGNAGEGRPMSGCDLSRSGSSLKIEPGYAITTNGDIVVFQGITKSLSAYGSGWFRVYIKYINTSIPEAPTGPTDVGKSTDFIGKSGTEEIVYDDYGVLDDGGEDNLVITAVPSTDTNDVFLGEVYLTFGAIISDSNVENTQDKGLFPSNLLDSNFSVPNLSVGKITHGVAAGDAAFFNVVISGTTTMTGSVSINGDVTVDDSKTMILPADAGKVKVGAAKIGYSGTVDTSALTNVEIINGLIVGTPA